MTEVKLDQSEISIVKAALVLVFCLSVGWGFVVTVVLPINSMQVQLAQIQTTLKSQTQNFATLQSQETLDANNILILQQKGLSSQTTINNK